MDDWVFLLLTLSLCFAVTLLLSSLSTKNKNKKAAAAAAARRLPPGPKTIPIIGPLLLLRRMLFDIEPLLRRLRAKYGPVVTLRLSSRPAIFVSDRGAAHRALVGAGAAFADRLPATEASRLLTSNRFNVSSAPYGPRWRLLRRNLASEVLHPSRVRHAAPLRRWVLSVLVGDLKSRAAASPDATVVPMDSFPYAMFCLLVLMCFGEKLDEKAIRQVERVQKHLLSSFFRFNVFAVFPRITKLVFRKRWEELLAIRRRQEELFIPLIRKRAAAKQGQNQKQEGLEEGDVYHSYVDSLLDLRLPEEEGGRGLSEGEMVSLCSEFLSGGTDTTATALQWIMANLVRTPEIQSALREEVERAVGEEAEEVTEEDLRRLPYLKAVILEGLRRHPPGHFVLPHTVAEDVALDGYSIPKGAVVNFTVAEMGWDEAVWEAPMEFRPERFLPGGPGEDVDITGTREIKMMPFGAGRRICPGMGLAMLHLEYFVANLVREFEWKAEEGKEVDLSEKLEFTVVMKYPLRARLIPRRSN